MQGQEAISIKPISLASAFFGGPFRKFASSAKLGLLVLTLLTLSGCNGGCMAPPDILDFPDDVPELEQTQSGDLTGAIQEIVKEAAK